MEGMQQRGEYLGGVTNLKAFLPLVKAYQAFQAPRTSPSTLAAQPLNLADRFRRQTLGFRSLRVLGVGLLSYTC
ncbi:UNVERIFIED_CONTAM: hypothetical protein Sradi_3780600 [Sesamum radiatum]|uniref:Uncharacterized protein n=1 Tax=Sesamum radiatum TaxID=300843 RepID=A0AAW2Q023_SESRA